MVERISKGGCAGVLALLVVACGHTDGASTFPDDSGLAAPGQGAGGGQPVNLLGGAEGGPVCAACAEPPTCPSAGTSTTISGSVYDPAGVNPLYNVTVYVPNGPLPAVGHGASCDACGTLFPSIFASAVTDAAGHFSIANAPAGASVPLIVQAGKWRRSYTLKNITPCVDNPQTDKSLRLPRNASEGDLPDIGVSTGGADSLECLPLRIGVDASEYVGGAGAAGHIHIFQGYGGATTSPAAPTSPAALWDQEGDLSAYDLLLLSCEGRPTASISPAYQQMLVDYAGAGGRVFASHYQYAWFNTGPFASANLATWTPGANQGDDTVSVPANVITTLPSGQPFPEGVALSAWLTTTVGALSSGQLPVYYARHNADVTAANVFSQPWLALDPSSPFAPGSTQYFTFDTPISAPDAGGGHCGRVAYSDLHVSGGPGANEPPSVAPDYAAGQPATVPAGCAIRPLTPQEKVLEFMLFDLSSCLLPVGEAPRAPR